MAQMHAFGDPEFFSTSQIRDYCSNARKVLRPMVNELYVSAEELTATLRYIRSAHPMPGGVDSRVRAKLVARHLHRAADALLVAQTSMVKTYLSFRRHYLQEINLAKHTRPRPDFRFDR